MNRTPPSGPNPSRMVKIVVAEMAVAALGTGINLDRKSRAARQHGVMTVIHSQSQEIGLHAPAEGRQGWPDSLRGYCAAMIPSKW